MAITGDNIRVLYCEKCGGLVGRECTLEDGRKFLEYSGIIIYELIGIVECPECGQPNVWTWLGQMPYAQYLEAYEKVSGKDAPDRDFLVRKGNIMREVTEFYCEHCQALIGQEYTFDDGKKFLQTPGAIIYGPVGILICSACDRPNVWFVLGRIPYAEYLENLKRILESDNGAQA